MLHGMLRAGAAAGGFGAGLEPKRVSTLAGELMGEGGIDISAHTSDRVYRYRYRYRYEPYDLVVNGV